MKFVTLGPEGSCHDNALKHYLKHYNFKETEIIFVSDFLIGIDLVHENEADYLVQCSADPKVHLVTEKYFTEIRVVDTFIFPTQEIVLLEREEIKIPHTLGLVKVCEGYLDGINYAKLIYENAKPIVGYGLLEGKYDAGITTINYFKNYPERFRLRKYIGEVLTTWIIYGRGSTFKGNVLSVAPIDFYDSPLY
ncbi:MAG: hypothetical protein LBL58_08620 [Tannerellaceae bacterium]|nr:hypothetical protein [Tannerellaceae bacterium]